MSHSTMVSPALEHWEDSRPSKESRNGCPSQDSNVLLSPTGTISIVESLKIKSCFWNSDELNILNPSGLLSLPKKS